MSKLTKNIWILRSIFHSIYFNLRHLPFHQAIKLPILLYKPTLINNTGIFVLKGKIRFGMIQLGRPTVPIFPNSGIVIENRGRIVFNGKCSMGNGCAISVGKHGILNLGDGFSASTGAKIVCYHSIIFHEKVRVGWQSIFLDTDFHSMKSIDGKRRSKGYGSIEIGQNCWIASYCKILKGTKIPSYCTVASNTLLNRICDAPSYSLIYNSTETKFKQIDMWRDITDDAIQYANV